MAGLIRVRNTVEMVTTLGNFVQGKHGAVGNTPAVAVDLSMAGIVHHAIGTLAGTTADTIYDDVVDLGGGGAPAVGDYLWFKADQDCQHDGNAQPHCRGIGLIAPHRSNPPRPHATWDIW